MADTLHDDTTAASEPPGSPLESVLAELKQAIWGRRAILGDIMRKHGGKLLFEYARDFMDVNKAVPLDPFKPELINVAEELITARLGADVGKKAAKQLKKLALVSTADHHAPIDHPFWVNANIISGIPYAANPDPDIFSLIVFSFASVSINNASGYPRGILFHGQNDKDSALIRLPILPDKLKMSVIYGTRAFTREDLQKAEQTLRQRTKDGDIAPERAQAILEILEREFGNEDVLGAPDLSTQITKINYRLWPQLFHARRGDALKTQDFPQLIYLDIETLVSELFLRRHLTENTLLHRLLFDIKYRTLAVERFDGIPGGFSSTKDWGTFLFWALDDKMHRVRLELEGNRLVSKTRPELSVDLTPEAIALALREKRIFPGMLLCYLTISLYYGMKCLGGFCQVHDLTMAKEMWGKYLRDVGEPAQEAEALVPIQTKELGGDGMVLSYMRTPHGDLVPATGIDMILDDTDTRFANYVELSKHVRLSEIMDPMLPEMYTVLYPFPDRDPRLSTITPEQILNDTGLGERLLSEFEHLHN
jgi:hypothetical protein